MSISLDAKQKTVLDIFNIKEQYSIPKYQRAYSWGYDECYMLYIDLIEAFEKRDDYFLGNIIIARSKDIETKNELEVIDGQQRLTSLLIVLKVLNVLYPNHKGTHKCIWLESLESDEEYPRIESDIIESSKEKHQLSDIFNVTDQELSIDAINVVKENEIDVKKLDKLTNDKFYKNTLMFYYWIKYYFENNKKEENDIRNFINYLLESVTLLPIELYGNNKDEATEKALKIFETINNRGLNLSDADIFKSKLFILSEDKDGFIKSWNELKEHANILKISVNDIFRYYSHIIRGQEKIVSNEINLREFFTVKENSPFKLKNCSEIMNDLFQIADILNQLKYLQQKNERASKWLQILELYTNQFPKFAVVVYVYKNGFDSGFEIFLKILVRLIYSKGSTTYIKWDIYTLIYDITYKRELKNYITLIDKEDIYLGRLKKGFILLGYYLSNENAVYPYKIERVLSIKDKNVLRNNWDSIEYEQLETILNEIGNFLVFQEKKEFEMIKKDFLCSYESFKAYNEYVKNKITDFFEAKL